MRPSVRFATDQASETTNKRKASSGSRMTRRSFSHRSGNLASVMTACQVLGAGHQHDDLLVRWLLGAVRVPGRARVRLPGGQARVGAPHVILIAGQGCIPGQGAPVVLVSVLLAGPLSMFGPLLRRHRRP